MKRTFRIIEKEGKYYPQYKYPRGAWNYLYQGDHEFYFETDTEATQFMERIG